MGIQGYTRNEEAMAGERARLEREAVRYGNNAPMLYLRAGSTMLRILPPWDDKGQFFKQIYKHRVRAGDSTFEGLCPSSMEDLHCPICWKSQELYESKNEAALEQAKQLKPRGQFLYNVICFQGPANKKGALPEFGKVYVMEAGVMVHRQLIELDQDEGAGWADITNVAQGVAVIIKRTGMGLDTKYDVNPTLIEGQPRSDIMASLAGRGIDPNSLELNNLDETYAMPDQVTLEEVANKIRVPGAPAQAAPQFATAAPAAAAPVAPVAQAPVAAPAVAVAPVAPVAAPVAPIAALPATSVAAAVAAQVPGTVPGSAPVATPAVPVAATQAALGQQVAAGVPVNPALVQQVAAGVLATPAVPATAPVDAPTIPAPPVQG